MTLTTYPPTTDSSDLAVLNLSRLLTRLEYNILSPNADLKLLRRSEYHRMRVAANIDYARTHLQSLERSLPQVKAVDRRHEIQSDLSRNRQTLKRLQNVLDEIQAEVELRSARMSGQATPTTSLGNSEDESEFGDGEDLLGTPEGGSTTDEGSREDLIQGYEDEKAAESSLMPNHDPSSTMQPPVTTATVTMDTTPTATLRNRHYSSVASTTATATGTSFRDSHYQPTSTVSPRQASRETLSKAESTERALASDRLEQENLTSSLLTLAKQLKSSSQAFQASLESEKSVLARAVDGLDRTTGNMQAAERRMGMLRRMTEGKGWWGRMMLYAWIFGLWVVAVLIVFVGPKLRF